MSTGPRDDELVRYCSRWRSAVRLVAMRILFRAFVASLVRVRAVRSTQLDQIDRSFVLVANHSSHLDAPVLVQNLPTPLVRYLATGVASDYFFNHPVPKLFTQLLFNAFPIDRDRSGTNSGLSGRLLDAGVPVLVFPEATRSRSGRIQKFSPGAAALAAGQDVPVLPAALIGTFEAMPKGRRWPVPGRPQVTVVFGDPLRATADESRTAFAGRIQRAVADLYAQHHPDGKTLDYPSSTDTGTESHPRSKEN